ncbi:LPXTG cell wall anchor domain-containing protein [Murdochiella vaginalis]|uniref:LPXTG cell wall anchor domain-containing protein n=1 Tax=Murdochiella vaginalis TaxID=1852373 RepID=UPI0008FDE7EE|nr:LPXTG cell wall anchor domain-containing protein [Murdochiella vaginalis]
MKSVIKTHPLWKRGLAFFAAFAMILAMVMPSVPVARAEEATTKSLDADLLVDGDTGKQVLEKKYQDEMTFTGTLDVSKIKKQMQDIEDTYGKFVSVDKIMLDPKTVQSTFTATLKLPEGLEFTAQSEGAFTGANGVFTSTSEIDKASNTATIKFLLTNPTGYDTYLKLKKAITETVDDTFTFSVSHVKFAQGAHPHTPYVATGTVEGDMQATAILFGHTKPFAFKWNGVQIADKAYMNQQDISAAVKYTKYVEHINLLGDIKVGDETQNKSVYRVKKDDKVAFTGTLDVSPVKAQLAKIEGLFNPGNQIPDTMIALSGYKGEFKTTLALPAEMEFDPATNPTVTLSGDNEKYEIKAQSVDPATKTITITMVVKKEVKTFADLKDAVNGMKDELQVTVDGVVFNSQARKGKNYTVTGTMTGGIEATATLTPAPAARSVAVVQLPNPLYFNLSWDAIQKPEGLDSTKPVGTDDITFTVRIPKPTLPTPDEPSSSSSSSSVKPVEPEQPSSEMPVTPKPNKKPVAPKTGDISAVIYAGSAILSTTGLAAFVLKKNKRNDK